MRIAFFNVMNRVKLRRICMELSENNGAYISKTVYPEMLVFGSYKSFRYCYFRISRQIP